MSHQVTYRATGKLEAAWKRFFSPSNRYLSLCSSPSFCW